MNVAHISQVANKKQRDTAAQDAEMQAQKAKFDKTSGADNSAETVDILGEGDDEDVIF